MKRRLATPCKRCNGTGAEPDQELTGQFMRAKRTDAGMSLRQLGDAIGYSAPYLSDLELGRRLWSSEMIHKAEKAITKHQTKKSK